MDKIITIDLDNVLCPTAEAFLEYYEDMHGKKVLMEQIRHAYFHENEVFDAVHGWDAWSETFEDFMQTKKDIFQPIHQSQEILGQLRTLGYTLHVVTGRHTGHIDMTHTWIEKYYPGVFADIHFSHALTDQEITKGAICQDIGAMLHVDDFIDFSTSIVERGIPVLIYDKPWNQHVDTLDIPLFHRVNHREDIYTHIVDTYA